MEWGDAGYDETTKGMLNKDPPMRMEGCDRIRGKMGEWQEQAENDLTTAFKGLLMGLRMRGAGRNDELREKHNGSVRHRGPRNKAYQWVETEFPSCQMDEVTLEGMCSAMTSLGLNRIFFVGDALQGQMVLSLWTLLGLSDYPGHKTMGAWNRVVECPTGRSFEIAYVRNDDLAGNLRPDITETHSDYPWVKTYSNYDGRTLLVVSTGSYLNQFDRFKQDIIRFATSGLDDLQRPEDIVVYRTTAPGHRDCEDTNPDSNLLTEEEFVRYNDFAMKEFFSREKGQIQWAPVVPGADSEMEHVSASASWSGTGANAGAGPESGAMSEAEAAAGSPQPRKIHLLDVYPMTILHPEGGAMQDGKPKEMHDCAHEYLPGPPDSWNHMLYSQMIDLVFASRESQRRYHTR